MLWTKSTFCHWGDQTHKQSWVIAESLQVTWYLHERVGFMWTFWKNRLDQPPNVVPASTDDDHTHTWEGIEKFITHMIRLSGEIRAPWEVRKWIERDRKGGCSGILKEVMRWDFWAQVGAHGVCLSPSTRGGAQTYLSACLDVELKRKREG